MHSLHELYSKRAGFLSDPVRPRPASTLSCDASRDANDALPLVRSVHTNFCEWGNAFL